MEGVAFCIFWVLGTDTHFLNVDGQCNTTNRKEMGNFGKTPITSTKPMKEYMVFQG